MTGRNDDGLVPAGGLKSQRRSLVIRFVRHKPVFRQRQFLPAVACGWRGAAEHPGRAAQLAALGLLRQKAACMLMRFCSVRQDVFCKGQFQVARLAPCAGVLVAAFADLPVPAMAGAPARQFSCEL